MIFSDALWVYILLLTKKYWEEKINANIFRKSMESKAKDKRKMTLLKAHELKFVFGLWLRVEEKYTGNQRSIKKGYKIVKKELNLKYGLNRFCFIISCFELTLPDIKKLVELLEGNSVKAWDAAIISSLDEGTIAWKPSSRSKKIQELLGRLIPHKFIVVVNINFNLEKTTLELHGNYDGWTIITQRKQTLFSFNDSIS